MSLKEDGIQKNTQTKLTDLKKRITLVEGQRKALYRKHEKDKIINSKKEKQLEQEVSTAQRSLISSLTTAGSAAQ